MTTREALKNLPRRARPVELPGGGSVHVRDLSLADLRRIDARAAAPEIGTTPGEREVRAAVLLAAYALAEEDGTAVFPDPTDEDLAALEGLTVGQLEAIAGAAVPSKADAKN